MLAPIDSVLSLLARRVCPLYVPNDRASRSPQLVGSSVLFRDDNHAYLVTASHVLDGLGDRFLVAGDRGFLLIGGPRLAFGHLPGRSVDADVGILRLDPATVERLEPHYLWSTRSDVGIISDYNKFVLYAFLGYPFTKNQPVVKGITRVWTRAYFYLAREFEEISALGNEGKNSKVHFALAIPPKVRGLDGKSRRLPKPQGISGGGVWKLTVDDSLGYVCGWELVGVAIERTKRPEAFVATRFQLALGLLDRFTDPREEVPQGEAHPARQEV